MRRQGVYLVIASHVVGNVFVTQLVDKFLSKKEQKEIQQKGGDILISRTEDSHEVYQMSKHLDPPTFRKRSKMCCICSRSTPEQEASVSNVAGVTE